MSLRGAVSIARRLQDPLAELVKIDPKSIGVGQYQHDLAEHQAVALARRRGGGLRERGGRGCEHGLGAAACARFGHQRRAREEHRGSPRRKWSVQETAGSCKRCRASGRRLSSNARASCASRMATIRWTLLLCIPKPIPWCAVLVKAAKTDIKKLIGNAPILRGLSAEGVRGRKLRLADRDRHSARVGEAGPRSASSLQDRDLPGGRGENQRPASRAWCSKAW